MSWAVFGVVVLLDKQPVFRTFALARLQPDQDEMPVQPLAAKDEFQLAAAEALFRVADRLPGAAIPGLDRARAILAGGDGAGEVAILFGSQIEFATGIGAGAPFEDDHDPATARSPDAIMDAALRQNLGPPR